MKDVYFASFKLTTDNNYSYPVEILSEVKTVRTYDEIDEIKNLMLSEVKKDFKKKYPDLKIRSAVTLNFNFIKTVR